MKRKKTFEVPDVEDFERIVLMSIFSEMMFKARKGREAEFDSLVASACNAMFEAEVMAFMMGANLLPKPNTAGDFISASRFYLACIVPNRRTIITVATLPENHKEENKK